MLRMRWVLFIHKTIVDLSLGGALARSLRLPRVLLPTHTHERQVFQLSAKTNAQRRYASSRNNNETSSRDNSSSRNDEACTRNDEREIGRRMQVMVRCPTPEMDGQMLVEENVRRVPRMR